MTPEPSPSPEPPLPEVPNLNSTHEALVYINNKVQEILSIREQNNFEELKVIFRRDLLPFMLQLRLLNRQEKIDLDARQRKVRDLNEKLIDLQLECDSLAYEAATINSEVHGARRTRQGESDMEICPPEVDHATRMKLLDEEEKKRKDLREELLKLGEETKSIEIACSNGEAQLDQVKPYIRQLLEKVSPTLQSIRPVTNGCEVTNHGV